MTLKKQVIWITIIILLFTICLGCTSFSDTTFSVITSKVVDYHGFPSLILDYCSNDDILVKVIDPNGQIIFSEEFYVSQTNIVVPLATYRNFSYPGIYLLNVDDKNHNRIYNESYIFINTNFSIKSVKGHWWKESTNDSVYNLLGLSLEITNNGDFPVYPYSFDFSIENISLSGEFFPDVILPGSTNYINCSLFINNITSGEKNCSILVKSKNNGILIESNFKLYTRENTPTYIYKWKYNVEREINIPYPSFLHSYYNKLERLNTNDYAAYVFDPYDDQYLDLIMNSIFSTLNDNNISKINLVASFIQNLEYGEDDPKNSSFEYPLYPTELLDNRACDCEDRSILGGSLLILNGYNVSLISLPKHMAIGINPYQNLPDFDYYVDEYYYLETTIENMVLGEIPKLYKNISDQTIIFPLESRPILIHEWKKTDGIMNDGQLNFIKLKIIVENIGNEIAKNIKITGALFSEDDTAHNQETIFISNLLPGEKELASLKVYAPQDMSVILKTKIYLDDIFIEEKQSTIIFS